MNGSFYTTGLIKQSLVGILSRTSGSYQNADMYVSIINQNAAFHNISIVCLSVSISISFEYIMLTPLLPLAFVLAFVGPCALASGVASRVYEQGTNPTSHLRDAQCKWDWKEATNEV